MLGTDLGAVVLDTRYQNTVEMPNSGNPYSKTRTLDQLGMKSSILEKRSNAPLAPSRKGIYTKNRTHKKDPFARASSVSGHKRIHLSDSEDDSLLLSDDSDIEALTEGQFKKETPDHQTKTVKKKVNMFKKAKESKGVYKTSDKEDDYEVVPKVRSINIPQPVAARHKPLIDESLLTEEEKLIEAGGAKSLRLAKMISGPTDDFAEKMQGRLPSLEKPNTVVVKSKARREEEKQMEIKKALTEDETKIEESGNKFSKLVHGLTSGAKENESFASKLMKSKVKKQEDIGERSLLKVDLDEEIDSGLKHNFEELDEGRNFKKQRKIVEKKYNGKTYPGGISRDEIEEKVKNHLSCIPKILNGKIASPYYGHASDIAKNSSSAELTSTEFLSIPIAEFTIGFYGAKRQAIIASIIKRECLDKLNETLEKNKTMKFWSLESFTFYVLACDVAVRMAADDLHISTGEAFDVLFDTVDYGKYITDAIPI